MKSNTDHEGDEALSLISRSARVSEGITPDMVWAGIGAWSEIRGYIADFTEAELVQRIYLAMQRKATSPVLPGEAHQSCGKDC